MQKNSITNKITPCCGLPFSVVYWWISNLTLNSESDRNFILSKISQNGSISIDAWKILINSGTLEADASLTKAEFLAWFDCGRQPSCEQFKLIIEGYKIGNYDPMDEYGVGWTEISDFEVHGEKIIKKIINYVGGIGDLPTELSENIGKYYAELGGFTTNKDLATDFKATGGIIGGNEGEIISFSTDIFFDKSLAISRKTVTGALVFRPIDTGAKLGYGTLVELTANGVDIPSLSAFNKISGSSDFINTNGTKNYLYFFYDGVNAFLNIFQGKGTTIWYSPPTAQPIVFNSLSAGATFANNTLTGAANTGGILTPYSSTLDGFELILSTATDTFVLYLATGNSGNYAWVDVTDMIFGIFRSAGTIQMVKGAGRLLSHSHAGNEAFARIKRVGNNAVMAVSNNGNTWTDVYTEVNGFVGYDTAYIKGLFAAGTNGSLKALKKN